MGDKYKNDEALKMQIEKAMRGDQKAFEAVLSRKQREVIYIASRYCEPQDIEDYAQEALILMFKNITKLRDPDRFNDWMYAIVRNTCHYQNRRRRERKRLVEITSYDPLGASILNTVEEDREEFLPQEFVENAELRASVMEEINTLPQHYQDCLLMFYFERMSYDQIAGILQLGKKDVANYLMRAKKVLKDKLEKVAQREFIVSVMPLGTIPALAKVFELDAASTVTPEVCSRVMENVLASITNAGSAAAAGTTVGKTALKYKILLGTVSVLTIAGIATGVTRTTSTGNTAIENEMVQTSLTAMIQEIPTPQEIQTVFEIRTLADMIGKENEEKLLSYVEQGVESAAWKAFINEIGAQEKTKTSSPPDVYRLYLLEKQNKQLILTTKGSESGGEIKVRYRFGDIKEIPNMMEFVLEFDE